MYLINYSPSPIILPSEAKQNKNISGQLREYLSELVICGRAVVRPEWDLVERGKEYKRQLTAEEEDSLLDEPLPLYFDLIMHDKQLLAIGPALPELDKILGDPIIQLSPREDEKDCRPVNYFHQYFNPRLCKGSKMIYSNALKYLVIHSLPDEFIKEPHHWRLSFSYTNIGQSAENRTGSNKDTDFFTQIVYPRINPFAGETKKLTLVTVQKDNPPQWIAHWCDYYAKEHSVERIIIYNNGKLEESYLKEIRAATRANNYEVHFVEWDFSYQAYFSQCQIGALTHASFWAGKAISFLLNFDVDEYLVNRSETALYDYLRKISPGGIGVPGFDLTLGEKEEINVEQTRAVSIDKLVAQSFISNSKYIIPPYNWHLLTVHKALRKDFPPQPAFWHLILSGRRGLRFFLACCFYWPSLRLFYAWQGLKRRLGLGEAPTALTENVQSSELYYIHYSELNTGWKKTRI